MKDKRDKVEQQNDLHHAQTAEDHPCDRASDDDERLHSSLDYVPPIEFEQSYYAALNRELQPT